MDSLPRVSRCMYSNSQKSVILDVDSDWRTAANHLIPECRVGE
jgi:hypothetical protein